MELGFTSRLTTANGSWASRTSANSDHTVRLCGLVHITPLPDTINLDRTTLPTRLPAVANRLELLLEVDAVAIVAKPDFQRAETVSTTEEVMSGAGNCETDVMLPREL